MNKLFRLMHIVYSLEMGGVEKLVVELAKRFDRDRFDVSVCTLTEGGVLRADLEKAGIKVFTVKKGQGVDYSLFSRLRKHFVEQKPDLVHSHNPAPWLYGAFAAKVSGIRHIVHTEHSNLPSDEIKMLFLEKILSRISSVIISDSHVVTRRLVEGQKLSPANIVTVVNGIDTERFNVNDRSIELRRSLGIADEEVVIGNVARLEPVKDHSSLLKAFSILVRNCPRCRLILAGDGSLRRELERQTRDLKITESVCFLGMRNDIPSLLSIFDVFVLSSLSEGLPLVLLEAMAAKRPVVATRVGGNIEVVDDGVTGLLVPPNDADTLAHYLSMLTRSPHIRQAMGEKGRLRVKQLFDFEKMLVSYENIYADLLSRKD
ncbi:MAG: putative glycosyltransferase EpsF [Pelotomaculum sp. PtaU1.Bin065]|nr:MAG: putative glycosyltransferase EpsF [Pelotomaculum sp. PtaU1.Bin065]